MQYACFAFVAALSLLSLAAISRSLSLTAVLYQSSVGDTADE